ncbi:hypothetical protein ACJX0J_019268, partial [Zea mays]
QQQINRSDLQWLRMAECAGQEEWIREEGPFIFPELIVRAQQPRTSTNLCRACITITCREYKDSCVEDDHAR